MSKFRSSELNKYHSLYHPEIDISYLTTGPRITKSSHPVFPFSLQPSYSAKMSPSADSIVDTSSRGQRLSIVVTGGASGIGLAITRHFAAQGHMVAVLDVNSKTGPDVVAEVSKQYPQATVSFRWCDVSSWEGQYAVFDQVYREHGDRIDIVIANAGISDPVVGALDCTPTEFPRKPNLKMQDINLNGVIYSQLYLFLSLPMLYKLTGNNCRCWTCCALYAQERSRKSSSKFERLYCLHIIISCHLSVPCFAALFCSKVRHYRTGSFHGYQA